MIDLLDRLTTDARIRSAKTASRREQRAAKPVSPFDIFGRSPYGAALNEQLVRESETPNLSEREAPASGHGAALPRALILITTETLCLNCGERWRSPCHSVFAEYDARSRSVLRDASAITKLLDWCHKHNHRVLNEHQTVTVHSPACERCF
jgi:hypothetical protein